MFSITGYFFDGSKLVGRMMMPQMSVWPSRPFATKTSGAFQPVFARALMSPRSTVASSELSEVCRSSTIGARSSREY
jgi:hypothetical protein